MRDSRLISLSNSLGRGKDYPLSLGRRISTRMLRFWIKIIVEATSGDSLGSEGWDESDEFLVHSGWCGYGFVLSYGTV
jgi:hypothetical protein